MGVIVGIQKQREIEIWNSFEVPLTADGDFDAIYFNTKRDQYKQVFGRIMQVFPAYEFLGWYITGQIDENEMKIHQQVLVTLQEGLGIERICLIDDLGSKCCSIFKGNSNQDL